MINFFSSGGIDSIPDHSMGSTFRDRTAEFYSLSQTLKKIGAIPSVNQDEDDPASSSKRSPPGSSRSEFNKKASRIGLRIHETSQKIARLAKCTVLNQDLFSSSSYLICRWNHMISFWIWLEDEKKLEKCSVFDPDSGIRLCDFDSCLVEKA